jgi:hypothetical protein
VFCSLLFFVVPRSVLDVHVCEFVGCVLSCCVLCRESPRCPCVLELVGCVLSCCVLYREVPSMLMCVRVGGLTTLLETCSDGLLNF